MAGGGGGGGGVGGGGGGRLLPQITNVDLVNIRMFIKFLTLIIENSLAI